MLSRINSPRRACGPYFQHWRSWTASTRLISSLTFPRGVAPGSVQTLAKLRTACQTQLCHRITGLSFLKVQEFAHSIILPLSPTEHGPPWLHITPHITRNSQYNSKPHRSSSHHFLKCERIRTVSIMTSAADGSGRLHVTPQNHLPTHVQLGSPHLGWKEIWYLQQDRLYTNR